MFYGYDVLISTPPYVFGDGKHETTRFLLYFLNRYANGKSVMDAGCGSGILSIFASKCGAKVTAVDCDDNAVDCTLKNAETNNATISVIRADISMADLPLFDIVVANFARYDASMLLPRLASFVKSGGLLLTTWYKELPKEELTIDFEIIDHIEGIDYDCYALKKIFNASQIGNIG